MAQKKCRKKSTRKNLAPNLLTKLVKQGKQNVQAEQHLEAIAAYEQALDHVRQSSQKTKRRYEWLWTALAEQYIHLGQVGRAQTLYQEHLTDLLKHSRVTKFQKIYLASHNVAGVDLQVKLIPPLRETGNPRVIHQFSRPIIDDLFNQVVGGCEFSPDPFVLSLIDELLPQIQTKPSPSESLESRLTQPNGLIEVLEEFHKGASSPIPLPAMLPAIDESKRWQELHTIWKKRVHGTRMYRGAGYGVRTALFYLIDMLEDLQGITRVEIEGIEDFDIYYDPRANSFPPTALPPRVYVQVKSRDPEQPAWSVSELKDVLNNFAEVHCRDPLANFLLLTDHHFGQRATLSGILDYPNLWAFDQNRSIRDDILKVLTSDLTTDERFDLETFLRRIHFRVLNRDLEYVLVEKLADFTDSPKGVAARYYDALFEETYKLAEAAKSDGGKKAFSKPDLERFLHEVITSVDISAIKRPLRRGNLELLTFAASDKTSYHPDPNYYLGVYADVRHILAGQDILRPELMKELAIKLVQRNFCVLRSPSGTGKTTLMYRFAFEHRHSFAVYRLERLEGDTEAIQDCARYIKTLQPSSHSPVLLLIDDISRPEKRGWQELLKSILENPYVYVVAATREDEWSDFLARGINVEYIRLSLSENTAFSFHHMLKERGQLHSDYPDWREAYEASKTNDTALFLEYAHILTQGRHIQDVLSEQIQRIARQPAPDGAIQMNLLRSICTAHALGGRVPAHLLPDLVNSDKEELSRHLENLADEHLIVCKRENYIGLHEVRSHFLCELTHRHPPPSLQETLSRLLTYLPLQELASIVEGLCRNHAEIATQILGTLSTRLNREQNLENITEIIRSLCMASEWHYAQKVKAHLDQFGVDPVEINIFAVELAPALAKPSGIMEMDLFRAEARKAFATAPPRGTDRFERLIGPKLDANSLAEKIEDENDVATIVYFLNWLREVSTALVERTVALADISHLVTLIQTETCGQRAASLFFHTWRSNSTTYDHLMATLGSQQVPIDKLLASYPLVVKVEWDSPAKDVVHLHFWAEDPLDELGDEVNAHAKAVFLAGIARRMFPKVAYVRTTGLFETGREYKLGIYDPATKDMPVENFTVLEDVEKNRIWLRAIKAQYTSKTWYVYLRQQDSLRIKYTTMFVLIAKVLQTIRGTRPPFPSSFKDFARLAFSYERELYEESTTLPLPPDPQTAFMTLKDHDAYHDPGKEIHKRLLQGLYHVSPRKDADIDHYFRNYLAAIDRSTRFLCEYIITGDVSKARFLKTNLASAMQELNHFHRERARVQLRQTEHTDLSLVELRLGKRVQKATQYVFAQCYQHLWSEAELLSQKVHLLINWLDTLRETPSQKANRSALAQALCNELTSTLPSIDILAQIQVELQHSQIPLTSPEIQNHIRQLHSLIALDCFVALAHKHQKASEAARLRDIEEVLRAEGIQVTFGSTILKNDKHGTTWQTLPIILQVSDLMDIWNKTPAIFDQIFAGEFDEPQEFMLIITNGQAIIWPLVWTFIYRDRLRWDLARQVDPTSFLNLCSTQTDLELYSTHLDLPIAKEPEYIRAIQVLYNTMIQMSMKIARLREEIHIQCNEPKKTEHFLESDAEEITDVSNKESISIQTHIDFLIRFQAPSEFQGYHRDILKFIGELGEQLSCELDALKQIVANPEASVDIQTLPDMILNNLDDSINARSYFQTEEEIQAYLSTTDQPVYEKMDIPSKFNFIYFLVKNYFHFGITEYGEQTNESATTLESGIKER